ncbi:putative signal transducing protein [Tenacibaculum sediminilitoris]|uniref:putative signal transducing protein n=1 Tax=Tenacibaculum sediminilitoris TaxID=1820334 RepID=UPI003894BD27
MQDSHTILATFEYSTEAQVVKAKLESEDIRTVLMDEKTIDSDPLISQAIGGVKLLVHNNDLEKAVTIYNEIRNYTKDENGNNIHCPTCNSTKILVADIQRKNIFFMLFPFFESRKFICNDCKTIFK